MVQATENPRLDAAVAALFRAARGAQVLSTNDPLDLGSSRVLAAVVRRGPIRLSLIAQDSHIDLSTASRHIDTLVRQGLVAKSADPDDARAILVAATPQGREVLSVLLANRSAAIAPALQEWSAADRDLLITLLIRLADDLDGLIAAKEQQ
ncbi:MAG TPA: MarR family transcriptional regulator [Actinomycetota bacterium]|nr:MarR family transcriptional regulator [Actinomycetota bacterium]